MNLCVKCYLITMWGIERVNSFNINLTLRFHPVFLELHDFHSIHRKQYAVCADLIYFYRFNKYSFSFLYNGYVKNRPKPRVSNSIRKKYSYMYITEPISRSNKMVVAFIFGHKELLRYFNTLSKKSQSPSHNAHPQFVRGGIQLTFILS